MQQQNLPQSAFFSSFVAFLPSSPASVQQIFSWIPKPFSLVALPSFVVVSLAGFWIVKRCLKRPISPFSKLSGVHQWVGAVYMKYLYVGIAPYCPRCSKENAGEGGSPRFGTVWVLSAARHQLWRRNSKRGLPLCFRFFACVFVFFASVFAFFCVLISFPVCFCLRVCVFCTRVFVFLCLRVCISLPVCLYLFACVFVFLRLCVCIFACVFVFVCLCVCIWKHIFRYQSTWSRQTCSQ